MRTPTVQHRRTSGLWRALVAITCAVIAGSSLFGNVITGTPTAAAAAPWDGVPNVPAVYDQDVEAWWAGHPFNPASPSYAPEISSPTNVVNVRTQFNGSIQSAINSLPGGGGTLYFPAGTYTGGFSLVGKSGVHFIGEPGAVIRSGMQNYVLGCQMAGDYATFSSKVKQRDPAALTCATTGRIQDVYFKGLTFDGTGSGLVGIYMAAARNVVFDNVTFQNYYDPRNSHRGLITGNALLDNVWIRNSRFVGSERYAIYLDGLHGGGVIDSTFENGFSGGALLFLTNDDFSRDIDGNGRVDLPEQRMAQHVVVYRNLFKGSTYDLVSATGRQILVAANTATGVNATLANFQAKSSHVDAKLVYDYEGNRAVANRLLQVRQVIEVRGADSCPMTVNCAKAGAYQVRDNAIERTSTWSEPAREVNSVYTTIHGPNVVSNNCVGSTTCGPIGSAPTPTKTPVPTTATPTPAPATPTPAPATPTATPTTPPSSGQNLAANGSFDASTSGYPTSWRARSTGAWDGAMRRTGAGALRITGPAASTYSDQALTLKPSTAYTVSYWVKAEGASGPGVYVRYAQTAPSTYILRQGDKVTGTTDWKQLTFSFTTPANYVGGRLDVMWELTGGQAWVDDLTIVEAAGS